jgi:hypothetical protein
MQDSSSTGIVFVAIAVFFLAAVVRDFIKSEGKLTIARKVWLRLAVIFAGVAVALYFFQVFFF